MAVDTPENDEIPTDPQSIFLCALWLEMDQADNLSTGRTVMESLPEIQAHLEAAAALIREWRAKQA